MKEAVNEVRVDSIKNNKNIRFVNLSIYFIWKNIKSSYNNNIFKVSAPTWYNEINLPDGSYSNSDIQDYFELTINKHKKILPYKFIQTKIKYRIVFKVKTGYNLEVLSPETMKLLESRKKSW